MNKATASACQSAFREFCRIDHWASPQAVTLTMKQRAILDAGHGPRLVSLTRDAASQNYRHFLNLLSGMALGKLATRFGRRLNSVSVIEGGNGKRLHIHALIDCPNSEIRDRIPDMIRAAWRRTQWGHSQIDIQPDADAGWVNYISKLRDKPVYADGIDWPNYHNVDRRV